MKSYPSIDGPSKAPNKFCYSYHKYDGSNLRFSWSKKRGWYKFGTRKTMFDASHEVFGGSIELLKERYADIDKVFTHKDFRGVDEFTIFCEFFGAASFAGQHEPDDPKTLVLFDVIPNKKGMLGPKQFLDYFGHLEVAELVYTGNLNKEFINDVRNENIDIESKYQIKNKLPEGVICKGGERHDLWMCKIKTLRYLQEPKNRFNERWEDYGE